MGSPFRTYWSLGESLCLNGRRKDPVGGELTVGLVLWDAVPGKPSRGMVVEAFVAFGMLLEILYSGQQKSKGLKKAKHRSCRRMCVCRYNGLFY